MDRETNEVKRISGQVAQIHHDLLELDAKNLSRFNKAYDAVFLEVQELKEEVRLKELDERRRIFRVSAILLLLFIAFKVA